MAACPGEWSGVMHWDESRLVVLVVNGVFEGGNRVNLSQFK